MSAAADITVTTSLAIPSKVALGLWYEYHLSRVVEQRCICCMMNSKQSILRLLLGLCIGSSGLTNNTTSAQQLYMVHRYQDMFGDHMYALMLESLDGDVSRWGELPHGVREVFEQLTAARWVCQERTCDAFIDLVDVPAPDYIIEMVAQYFGDKDEWHAVADYCTCYHDASQLSYMALMFIYLANHSPGGARGEGITNMPQAVAFMASPYHRAGIKLTAAVYSKHMEWARFADGRSKVNSDSRCMSLRMLEHSTEERNKLQWVEALRSDWHIVFPEVSAFVDNDTDRAIRCGFLVEAERGEVQAHLDSIIEQGSAGAVDMAGKYCTEPYLGKGFSILMATDPHIAPSWAKGVLLAIEKNGEISLSLAERASFVRPPGDEALRHLPWTITCPICAFPALTYSAYCIAITDSFTIPAVGSNGCKRILEEVNGIIGVYGISHPAFIAQLNVMAVGEQASL
jgi:hypothetical protein